MYVDCAVPLDEWLDSLDSLVEKIVADYTQEVEVTPKSRELAAWLIKKLNGDIGPSVKEAVNLDSAGYLVPVDPTQTCPMLFTEALPTVGAVTPMLINPVTCPEGARRMAAKLGMKLSKKSRRKGQESKQVPVDDDASDFELDTTGEDVAHLTKGDDSDKEERVVVSDRFADLKMESVKDIDALLNVAAGVSITRDAPLEPPAARKSKLRFHSYEKLTRKTDEVKNTAVKPSAIIRDIVHRPLGEKHELDDRKTLRKKEHTRKQNELDLFDGMRRQTITPEVRQELQALNMRAFANPQAHYRGAKRTLDLAEAESGFFEMGVMVAGGLHDKPLKADGSTYITTTRTDKKRKTKSLVKELLL